MDGQKSSMSKMTNLCCSWFGMSVNQLITDREFFH